MVQRRLVRTGSSYMSQSELTQTFGIPRNASVDQVVIIWPSGQRSTLSAVKLNSAVVVRES
jgi:enediyne biosynthesis protein E4